MATAEPLFDPASLARPDTVVRAEPFAFLIAREQLPAGAVSALHEDFPKYSGVARRSCRPKTGRCCL